MEKYEGLKLVNKNGKTVLMTKSEYLELAKQKGWDTKIPRLEDGTYNCDIFGGDGVTFAFEFAISGILCLKHNAELAEHVSAYGGIILGDNASTYNLFSDDGDVVLGDHANTCNINGKNVICGAFLHANYCGIYATDGNVILDRAITGIGNISATEDIICDDEPAA